MAPAAIAARLAAVNPLLSHPLFAPPALAPAAPATACLRLDGLITPDMLNDDEYADVLADIRDECARSGRVTAVRVPRIGQPDVGAAFVRFASVAEAASAREALDRRVFDGNKVAARFVPEWSL
jgi:splicing factor U2AF subunit